MQMRYPTDFPPESRAAVAAEKMRAGKDFDQARLNPQRIQHGFREYLEAELRKYILRPFGVFVREACKLGLEGDWHVDRMEEAALEFLRLSTIEATSSHGYDQAGGEIGRNWISHWNGGIEPEVMREFKRSSKWQEFQDALLQVAERQEASTEGGEKQEQEIGEVTSESAEQEPSRSTLSRAEEAGMPKEDLSKTVDRFLMRCNQEPGDLKVIRKHIWLAAGHANARQFQYWQKRSGKATAEDGRNFRRILSMAPVEFIAVLKKRRISP